jgi:hypothetical protein
MVAKRQSEAKETKAYDRSEKLMICVFFSLRRILAASLLGDGETLNSDSMTALVSREIETNTAEQRQHKDFKDFMLNFILPEYALNRRILILKRILTTFVLQ